MNTKALLASLVLFCLLSHTVAQTKAPFPVHQSTGDDDVVKITTNLVQIDAVVTKDGRPVADLKAEDFEIFEDGKRQTITSFAYVSNTRRATEPGATPAAERDKSVPFTPLKRDDPRRTLAIVVDDLGLSAASMSDVRRQLRKFVAEKLQPHDLVAIVRTGAQVGALQQFTNDKRVLNRAVDQLRWNVRSRVGIDVLPPVQALFSYPAIDSSYAGTFFSSVDVLRFVLDALAELPGRKAMMVLSDSLPTESQDHPIYGPDLQPVGDTAMRGMALRRIAEKAIRSSVVIYSIDTQGLQTTGPTAADRSSANLRMTGHDGAHSLMAARSRLLFNRQSGGEMIARQTGGFQVRNSNDYKFERVLEDQSGYYLIGYRPTEETFDKKFHRITAKVKRSGMTLRTRYGFYGYSEEDDIKVPQPKTNLALMSPFGAQDITIDFSSFFANDKSAGSVIRSFLYLDAKEFTFVKANEKHEAKIELHGVIFGDNGVVVEQINHGSVVSLSDKDYQKALREGIRVRFDMPARKPGSYQVRVAARDVSSSRVGSAGQFVAVPDLKKKRLAASGIVLRGVADIVETETNEVASASPAVRRFLPNSDLYFAFVVYNAMIDGASERPNLMIESKLFRDGKRVSSNPEAPIDVSKESDLDRIFVSRMIRLGPDLEPGHYYLQLTITDKAAGDKQPPAVQWVDFEIVK